MATGTDSSFLLPGTIDSPPRSRSESPVHKKPTGSTSRKVTSEVLSEALVSKPTAATGSNGRKPTQEVLSDALLRDVSSSSRALASGTVPLAAPGSEGTVSIATKGSASSQWVSAQWKEDHYRGETRTIKYDPRNGAKIYDAQKLDSTVDIHADDDPHFRGFVKTSKLIKEGKVPHGWGTMCVVPKGQAPTGRSAWVSNEIDLQLGGQKIEGYWKEGVLEGHGTYWFPNGDRFAGIFREGMPGSKGTYWYGNGDVYRGDCIVSHGSDDESDDQRVPDASRRERKKPKPKIRTELSAFRRQGKGDYWYNNGSRYEGQFEANQRHGRGIMFYARGDVQEGIFQGSWEHGEMHGRGIFYLPSGEVEFGTYEKGEPTRHTPSVRWSADRKSAWKIIDGKKVERLSLEDEAGKGGQNHAPTFSPD